MAEDNITICSAAFPSLFLVLFRSLPSPHSHGASRGMWLMPSTPGWTDWSSGVLPLLLVTDLGKSMCNWGQWHTNEGSEYLGAQGKFISPSSSRVSRSDFYFLLMDTVKHRHEVCKQLQHLVAPSPRMKHAKRAHRETDLKPPNWASPKTLRVSHNGVSFFKLTGRGLSITFSWKQPNQ